MIARFDSINAYLADMKAKGYAPRSHGESGGMSRDWDDGVSGHEAVELATKGDPRIVTGTMQVLDRLNASNVGESTKARYVSDYVGSFVSVPKYLAGHPKCMKARRKVEVMAPHVAIYVANTSSCGVSAKDLMTRGIIILALLESLTARGVGVDLYILSETDAPGHKENWFYQCVQVDTRPLDLSVAGFAIAHPSFARNVMYAYSSGHSDGAITNWAPEAQRSDYESLLRSRMGMAPTDVYVPPPDLYNYSPNNMKGNPEGWINEKLESIMNRSEVVS